ncbi:unnamed protein product [Amoebophrya sp. A120]|nr:unnamed protein product [Amoebophrya sp. A120]|eukprot:GSA120T00025016001.1
MLTVWMARMNGQSAPGNECPARFLIVTTRKAARGSTLAGRVVRNRISAERSFGYPRAGRAPCDSCACPGTGCKQNPAPPPASGPQQCPAYGVCAPKACQGVACRMAPAAPRALRSQVLRDNGGRTKRAAFLFVEQPAGAKDLPPGRSIARGPGPPAGQGRCGVLPSACVSQSG